MDHDKRQGDNHRESILGTLPSVLSRPAVNTYRLGPASGSSELVAPVHQVAGVLYTWARPTLWLPPHTAVPPIPPIQEPSGAPRVLTSVPVLSSEQLKHGLPDVVGQLGDPGAYVPPWVEKASRLIEAFLGRLANDEGVRDVLLRIVDLYPHPVMDMRELLLSHIMSWDVWELYPDRWHAGGPARLNCGHSRGMPDSNMTLFALTPDYCEAVLHLCASLRLGRIWPRLIHSLVLMYLLTRNDPEGPSFEPVIFPNMVNPKEGEIDGYHPIPRARIQTPEGEIVVLNPGETKRQALRRIKNPLARKFVIKHHAEIRRRLNAALGHERLRELSDTRIEHVYWLFLVHVLWEKPEAVAKSAYKKVKPVTVNNAVKKLRKALHMQKNGTTARCLYHRNPPPFYGN